jgi:hypothetical protein
VTRWELLKRMAGIASGYGIDFDKDHPVHGGNHDKYYVGGSPWKYPAMPRSPNTPPPAESYERSSRFARKPVRRNRDDIQEIHGYGTPQ